MPQRTFEECYPIIKKVVEMRRYKWTFKASLMIDFDDVAAMIVAHCYAKWHLYDQGKALEPWVSRIADNQIINILRDQYTSTASPCVRCPCNLGNNQCSIYTEQGNSCGLFKEWAKAKKYRHEARTPLPIENHLHEISGKQDTNFNLEHSIEHMHHKMYAILKDSEWRVYKLLYIENLSEDDVAKAIGFKTTEKGRKDGYKRIRQIKNIIVSKAKKILKEELASAL